MMERRKKDNGVWMMDDGEWSMEDGGWSTENGERMTDDGKAKGKRNNVGARHAVPICEERRGEKYGRMG